MEPNKCMRIGLCLLYCTALTNQPTLCWSIDRYGCVQNCREIEIVERWNWVSEIVERWKQVSEIVEKYFPVKSSSQNLREIEFVENMTVSFRNCREIWKHESEIVEKGGFFQFVESRIKLLIGWARRWCAYEWISHGHLMAKFDRILLCCFWYFTKELCIIINYKWKF